MIRNAIAICCLTMSGLHDDNLRNKVVLSCFFLLLFVGFIFIFVLLHLNYWVSFVNVILEAIALRLVMPKCEL